MLSNYGGSLAIVCASVFSCPGQSPGIAVVLPRASALVSAAVLALANVKVFTLKLFM